MDDAAEVDVIVVGAGSAGCALAARLSEDPARGVLLVEAGPDYATAAEFPADVADATALLAAAPGHPNSWDFVGRLSPERPDYPIARGRIVGGSSALNGTIFLRGRSADFDAWAARGQDLWSSEQVRPFFVKAERDLDFAAPYHGDEGPMPVTRPQYEEVRTVSEAFVAACLHARFPAEPDKNAPGVDDAVQQGVGPIPRNVLDGTRTNTAMAYLTSEARGRPNLRILGGTTVRRVILDGDRVRGIETERAGQVVSFHAEQVVLSAGGIKTPQLLMLSGVGPAEALRRHGIPVIHDSPGVGGDIRDHPTVCLQAAVDDGCVVPDGTILPHTALHHSSPGFEEPSDLEISWGRAGTMLFLNIALNIYKSAGRITLASADAAAGPVIDLNYLSDPSDLPRMAANLRVALELLASPAFRELDVRLVGLDEADLGDAALRRWITANLATCLHTHNSTPMSPATDPLAAVDQRCRVHGTHGLRVADISIVPFIRTGPAATAVMIGERVAALMDDER